MAARPNPSNLKDRSGRLQAFARRDSDDKAAYNAPSAKEEVPPRRSETPQSTAPVAPAASKNDAATEGLRVPVPLTVPRNDPQSSSPKTAESPHKLKAPRPTVRLASPELGTHPAQDDNSNRAIFEGSQLGEDFMRSGLTTPQNEPEDVFSKHTGGRQQLELQTDKGNFGALNRHNGHVGGPQFNVGEDGRMVVKTGAGRRVVSSMNDGFQSDAIHERRRDYRPFEHGRAASPADRPRKLAIRDVRLPKPQSPNRSSQPFKERQNSPSPDHGRPPWQARYKEIPRETGVAFELDHDSETGHDLFQDTPRAQRTVKAPQDGLAESSLPPGLNLNGEVRTRKRARAAPDYDDRALSNMSFGDLEREPFDLDPARAASQNGSVDDADNLTKRLNQARHLSDSEQRSFFSAMSMEDWEQSGDWFVDRFSDIMARLRDARRDKRRTVREFEAEAAQREETVRRRSDAIDRKLVKMRQDGQRVVGDRVL